MHNGEEIKIFTGNSNKPLAEAVAKKLGLTLGEAIVERFADSESRIEIKKSVRNSDVYVIQSTCRPANENIMELLLMIDALRRAPTDKITVVMPWYGYARQDHKATPREPISARLVANLLEKAGASKAVTIDLHSGAIQGFFDIPVSNLTAIPLFCDKARAMDLKNPVVVAPDAGGVKRAKKFADQLGVDLAFINKFRPKPNVAVAMSLLGDVKGRDAIIIDDMVDTAGSIVTAAESLKKEGAERIFVFASHGPFSGPAYDRIKDSQIEKVIVTDSIPLQGEHPKIEQISVAPMLAEVIKRIHEGKSVSAPLENSQTEMGTFI